jgi:hypothetical protein
MLPHEFAYVRSRAKTIKSYGHLPIFVTSDRGRAPADRRRVYGHGGHTFSLRLRNDFLFFESASVGEIR